MLIDLNPVIRKQPAIYGSYGYASEDLEQALDLMHSGAIDRKTLISHRYPLDDVAEAFEAQCSPDAVKVVLKIGPSTSV
jgi:threonine dehydrogenase-like Zn-dependent dehydrogenase